MTNQLTAPTTSSASVAAARPAAVPVASGLWIASTTYQMIVVIVGLVNADLGATGYLIAGATGTAAAFLFYLAWRLRTGWQWARLLLSVEMIPASLFWVALSFRDAPGSLIDLFAPAAMIGATILVWLRRSSDFFRAVDRSTADQG